MTIPCLCRTRQNVNTMVVGSAGKKTDISKQGLNSIKNAVVKQNLMGVSKSMEKKDWVDAGGRKGKVCSPSSYLSNRAVNP